MEPCGSGLHKLSGECQVTADGVFGTKAPLMERAAFPIVAHSACAWPL